MSGAAARTSTPLTLLAFDFGERRIGVAVGQSLTGTATALSTVEVYRSGPDWKELARLVETWHPRAMVVGLPLNMDGTEQKMTRLAKRFGRELEARFAVPVHMVDERLSTREARQRMFERGDLRGDDDPVAAEIILEGWLDTQHQLRAGTDDE